MNVTERFIKYVSFPTASDEDSGQAPSTPGQLLLGKELVKELSDMGLETYITDKGYVYGIIPASPGYEKEPVIGLIAHMDTSDSASGDNIKPRIEFNYNGGDIILNDKSGIVMSPEDYPSLNDSIGCDLIVTDGTTLLGADDKAGIAEIMTLAHKLSSGLSVNHGVIKIAFTPDEEIGKGADYFDIPSFGADFAYTVDGGPVGELECENFNAASAVITIHGINIHPGQGKNKMKNSCLIAAEIIAMMPPAETPAHTEGYEGFYHLFSMAGSEENTILKYLIRDHDMDKFGSRKQYINRVSEYINSKYGSGTAETVIKDSYYNMKEMLAPYPYIIKRAEKAMRAEGVEPIVKPIRGGTDGSRLSWEGLPCPNISTGGYNYHGRFEYIPIQSLEKMMAILLRLVDADFNRPRLD